MASYAVYSTGAAHNTFNGIKVIPITATTFKPSFKYYWGSYNGYSGKYNIYDIIFIKADRDTEALELATKTLS